MTETNITERKETTSNYKFQNWAIGIFTVLVISLSGWSLHMLVNINSDVNLLKEKMSQIPTKEDISVIKSQIPDMQKDIRELESTVYLHDRKINILEYKVNGNSR